ncbi:MAG: hypothetical protein U1F37_17760 [Alphaproteobacteria bacterium]
MKDAAAKFDEVDALAPKLAAEYAERAAALPVLDVRRTALLHEPVYDCVRNEFVAPCQDPEFDWKTGRCWLARADLAGQFERCAHDVLCAKFGLKRPLTMSAVFAAEHIDIVGAAEHIDKPGLQIWRYVRAGPDRWHWHYFRAGGGATAGRARAPKFGIAFGTAPGGDDPPILARKVAAKPSVWLDALPRMRESWQRNAIWRDAAARCTHAPNHRRDDAPAKDGKVIIRCANADCERQIRVPAGRNGVIRCPHCGFRFRAAS